MTYREHEIVFVPTRGGEGYFEARKNGEFIISGDTVKEVKADIDDILDG